ncbi:GTPase family protein [Fusobacterium mortiferum]|uniref:GTPase family protein n=1 Tax=Fusobacterium mortiferum TaxID=850 RepID=UPI00195EE78C|nr:GTPase [Fusobacterium mortiferum]
MITGATGCGKSSTINALFETEKAKVSVGVDPETMDIQKYELDKLVLWDTPGLGDGKEKDIIHSKNIINKLHEKDKEGNALIDLVLVVLDGGSRDLGTSYELINSVIIPSLGEERKNRILVAINQADMAMKGKYWNSELNKPEQKLEKFLDEKVESVKKRIKEGSGVDVDPIYYCAGYKEEGMEQCQPYNLTKLLYYIIKNTPKEKRLVYMNNTNSDYEVWKRNDEIMDYEREIKKSFFDTVGECVSAGSEVGEIVGSIFGEAGRKTGGVIGGIVGGVIGIAKGIFSSLFG